jgi:hypothetical protein
MMKKRGQIWVETIIYTLIAFAMIGLVLIFVKPKIEEIRDNGIIEQSINILQEINSIISTIGDPGNQRTITLGISKGSLNIDGINDTIYFEIESKFTYSQPGEEVNISDVVAKTEERGEVNNIILTTRYNETHDITYGGKEELKSLSKASTPYKLLLVNKGKDSLNRTIIEVRVN